MTTPTEELRKVFVDFWYGAYHSGMRADDGRELKGVDELEKWFLAQQQTLLDRIDTEVIGEDARIDIPGASITNTANRHENELRTEQRKALQRIKGELGEGQ